MSGRSKYCTEHIVEHTGFHYYDVRVGRRHHACVELTPCLLHDCMCVYVCVPLLALSRLRSGAPEDMEVARERFSKGMDAELEKVWTPNPSIEEWWSTLRTTTINVASDCLGRERRRQPEWFTDKRTEIESVLRDRDSCYSTWMSTRKASDLDLYKKSRSAARCTMRRLKRDWLLRQAKDCEWFGLTAKSGWECIGNIKTTLGGMRPRAATAIRNKQGEICDTAEATGGRWREHFDGLLNIASAYDLEVVDSIEQRPVMTELGVVPECDEIWRALRGMKCGKACGGSEISVEMLKYGGPTLIARLHELIRVVWETGSVPQDWSDAILVPIPKKGDLGSCDNWRGISLLDVAGKLVARMIANRLQVLGERCLPDSQCGFRRGRGCSDMVFAVRQILEKLHEHATKGFAVFIDLRKAYDSASRSAECWQDLASQRI
eukprot:scpid84793/ scgid1426/ Transposon TX1 uncharacterized 149 kDa protein; ORF 2